FDEADLDAALARFEELSGPAPRSENTACLVTRHFFAEVAENNWDTVTEMLAVDYSGEDRRQVVGSGTRQDREAAVASTRVVADLLFTVDALVMIATRGDRLVLSRARYSRREDKTDEYVVEVLGVVEIGADGRITALVTFDLDDIKAAFSELDARYLAGEARAHARTWKVVTEGYVALNSREVTELAPDWINIDHRRAIGFAPGDMPAYIRATWDLASDMLVYIESVHRLSKVGIVVTHTATATSEQGFEAEWREIALLAVDGDLINRCELFDETDLDAALAKFDELGQQPRLGNRASQVYERYLTHFADRDWGAMALIVADDICADDRRRVVRESMRHGRDFDIANMQAIANIGVKTISSNLVATRGERLALSRVCFSGNDPRPEAFSTEVLGIIEIDANDRITVVTVFDLDDIDAA
ncbi:hypothetical protein NLX62_05825, partial [Mycobacteriaceae bacterium Msp059]|nr:hypothetical protein [Mycobacteriaceae bacterium Msp059]